MAEQIQSAITYERVRTKEPTWKPPEKRVEVVLYPKPGEEPFYPPSAPKPIEVPSPFEEPAVILNVETTGLMPFESRLISIAAVDVRTPENIIDFTGENEEKILKDFFAWFSLNAFEKVIGYNVSFDYRFLFTKAMKYGIKVPEFYKAKLSDVMQMMQQVKEGYVYGYNKAGKLDEWTMYFFEMKSPLTFEQVLKAWRDKELDKIAEHNRTKVEQTILLYALIKYAAGELSV